MEAKTSLTIYDEHGNIQQVAWITGFQVERGVIDPGARDVDDPIKDAAAMCINTPGFHWDYTINECVPNREAPDSGLPDEDPNVPQVDTIDIDADFDKIVFTLEWAEIEGVKIVKESVYIKVKVRVLLKDNSWSPVVDSLQIKYWKGEFKDLKVEGDYFKIRADSETMQDDDIRVHKDEILGKVSFTELADPLQIRFYYYAKGDPIAGGEPIESNTINKIVIVEDAFGASLGIRGMIFLLPIFMAAIPRRLEYAKAN